MEESKLHKDLFFDLIHQKMNEEFYVSAPEEVWNNMAKELDKLSTDKQFDDQLKEQLDQLHQKAPESLWANIAGSLEDSITTNSNELLENKIQEAFTKESEAPEYIWQHIDQQLTLDDIWRRMTPKLSRMRNLYLIRKRISQISIAAVFGGFLPSL